MYNKQPMIWTLPDRLLDGAALHAQRDAGRRQHVQVPAGFARVNFLVA